ncbi:MAG: ABC transporter substrate-binding protein [Pseudomonadota bacterium]
MKAMPFRAAALALGSVVLAATAPNPATSADDPVKIGMIVTLSGPPGALGKQVEDGFRLALEQQDGKLGGVAVDLIVEDDELKPDVALTKAEKLTSSDEVDIVVGTIFSNMLQAVFKPVIESDTILISPNAGPSTFAGRNCHPNFFVTSYQNNQNAEAMGAHAEAEGFKKVFLLAPNYQAGRDQLEGFKTNYTGEIADEVYTPLGHKDFSAELARIATSGADAIYTFMPGGMGVRLVKQFRAAGLADKMTFLSAFTVDETTLPAQKDDALGFFSVGNWAPDMELPRSARFVSDFLEEYGYVPGGYAMQAYDTALLIDSALAKTDGSTADKDALRAAIAEADFQSLRGDFAFNNNQYPIQDFFLTQVAKRADDLYQTEIVAKVVDDGADSFAAECKM